MLKFKNLNSLRILETSPPFWEVGQLGLYFEKEKSLESGKWYLVSALMKEKSLESGKWYLVSAYDK